MKIIINTIPLLSCLTEVGSYTYNIAKSKVPEETWPEIRVEIIPIRNAAGFVQEKQLAYTFIEKYKDKFSSLQAFTPIPYNYKGTKNSDKNSKIDISGKG